MQQHFKRLSFLLKQVAIFFLFTSAIFIFPGMQDVIIIESLRLPPKCQKKALGARPSSLTVSQCLRESHVRAVLEAVSVRSKKQWRALEGGDLGTRMSCGGKPQGMSGASHRASRGAAMTRLLVQGCLSRLELTFHNLVLQALMCGQTELHFCFAPTPFHSLFFENGFALCNCTFEVLCFLF